LSKVPKRRVQVQKPQLDDLDPLAAEIARRVGSVVGGGQRDQVLAQVLSVIHEEQFSGPIAHPRHLREYEEVLPGAADRIISMAENNLRQRREMEKTALEAEIADRKLGMWLGFISLSLLVAFAFVCILKGMLVGAGLLLSAAALGTIGAFIRGRSQ
jgi:uncharacterized membrane protein